VICGKWAHTARCSATACGTIPDSIDEPEGQGPPEAGLLALGATSGAGDGADDRDDGADDAAEEEDDAEEPEDDVDEGASVPVGGAGFGGLGFSSAR